MAINRPSMTVRLPSRIMGTIAKRWSAPKRNAWRAAVRWTLIVSGQRSSSANQDRERAPRARVSSGAAARPLVRVIATQTRLTLDEVHLEQQRRASLVPE